MGERRGVKNQEKFERLRKEGNGFGFIFFPPSFVTFTVIWGGVEETVTYLPFFRSSFCL